MFDLFAVNTAFQPKRTSSNATYTKSAAVEANNAADTDYLIGEKVRTKFFDKWFDGKVTGTVSTMPEEPKRWSVCFEDNYTMKCSEDWIMSHLKSAPNEQRKVEKQIDYIFVSNRWRSSVTNAKTRWGPSTHRNQKRQR